MSEKLKRYHVYDEDHETDADSFSKEHAFGNWYDVDDVREAIKDACGGERRGDIVSRLSVLFDIPELLDNELSKIDALVLALEDARLFAVLVESWSQPDCEIYKHELKSNAELSMERTDKALAI